MTQQFQPFESQAPIQYAGFWHRLFSFFLDAFIFFPFIPVQLFLAEINRFTYATYLAAMLVFSFWFHVILVTKYGATPGKLLMGIRIRNQFDDKIDFKAATVRYSVAFALSILINVSMIITLLSVGDADFAEMPSGGKLLSLSKTMFHQTLSLLAGFWGISEFIVMLFNKERRAIHDFMAGTIVVHDNRFPKTFLLPPIAWKIILPVFGLGAMYYQVQLTKDSVETYTREKIIERNLELQPLEVPAPTSPPETDDK